MEVIKTGSDYRSHFVDAEMNTSSITCSGFMEFVVESLHSAFIDGSLGGRLLDIGSGPYIHNIISAGKYTEEIYMTNTAQENVDVLNKWVNGGQAIQEKVVRRVCDLENNGQNVEECVNHLKAKVKNIVHIDILSLDSLKGSGIPKKYDVITSSTTLEIASQNKGQYITCVKNISTLLTPGGHLVLIGGLNPSITRTDNNKYRSIYLSTEELHVIFDEAGFDIQIFCESPCGRDNDNQFAAFFMVAKKVA